ncbi:MAG: hypothetical protein AB8G96_13205 [Phycisphaerales bacterium]
MPRPVRRPYHRIERERRFRLDAAPAACDAAPWVRLIDRFVEGAGLRIRRVESPDGTEQQTKLGQKRPDPDAPQDSRRRRMTTIYLDPGEADVLAELPGRTAAKRRWTFDRNGRTWAVDVWEEPPAVRGLVMAECETDSDAELAAIDACPWPATEVTDDPAFSAWALAGRRSPG